MCNLNTIMQFVLAGVEIPNMQQVKLKKCPREANQVADGLATFAHNTEEKKLFFERPPAFVHNASEGHLASIGMCKDKRWPVDICPKIKPRSFRSHFVVDILYML